MKNQDLHLMIDIETLGTKSNALIVSIGVSAFKQNEDYSLEIVKSKYFRRNLSSIDSDNEGRSISGDTLSWWLSQSAEARAELTREGGAQTCSSMLTDLTSFIDEMYYDGYIQTFWAYGTSFDMTILESAYVTEKLGKAPWDFRKIRCLRTVAALYKLPRPKREGTHHCAIDDAKYQVKLLSDICVAASIKVQ